MKQRVTTLVVAASVLGPAMAWACPNCVGANDRLSTTLKLVAVLMAIPFILVSLVTWAIKGAQTTPGDAAKAASSSEHATIASDGSSTSL